MFRDRWVSLLSYVNEYTALSWEMRHRVPAMLQKRLARARGSRCEVMVDTTVDIDASNPRR
eukprot:scaffold327780_cov61-Tisochrysis_lutea.AAC.8